MIYFVDVTLFQLSTSPAVVRYREQAASYMQRIAMVRYATLSVSNA